jgi:hypothetical protein
MLAVSFKTYCPGNLLPFCDNSTVTPACSSLQFNTADALTLELTETDHEVKADLLCGKISLGWVMLGENCVK